MVEKGHGEYQGIQPMPSEPYRGMNVFPAFPLPGSWPLVFLQTLSTECSGNIN